MQLTGLHHVTCVCSDAQRTLDFYRDRLGFSLVKKTVNFDDPHSYHLYLGDTVGAPGTLMTFFEWPRADPGRLGRGTLESIGLETPNVSEESEGEDPDGLRLRLYPGETPRLRDVTVIGNPDLYAGLFADDAPLQFADPVEDAALIGAGTTHHIAWRARDDAEEEAWFERPGRARAPPDGDAGSEVLQVDLLPHARRHPGGDRDGRSRLSRRRARGVARPGVVAARVARGRA